MTSSPIKNICVYGAGALGGAIAAKLASSKESQTKISVVARGAHLEAIRADGISLWEADADSPIVAQMTATSDSGELPPQDLVITGLKGHQLGAAAPGIAKLLHSGTRVVMILNGVPWWYFHRDSQSGYAEHQIEELDPNGDLWRLIGPERVIGCVAYQGAEVVAPGEVKLANNGHFILGEPSGETTGDIEAIAALLQRAGVNVSISSRIRDDIWSKLMGNAAFNPISALTRGLMSDIMEDPALAAMVGQVMSEVKAVAEALGSHIAMSVEERLERSRQIGPVRTSMLQDLLAGKALEITPLVGVVVSLGKLVNIPTPVSATILALVTQLDRKNQQGAE
ncbi:MULTISPECIES: 2-dehydropantoate 2-reductase [unclassified Rhizobium]|uniref:ketopantoate reductase family protein n=1 Tax=unclassified Rhizobium TaxID=2613769 RepID=UPI0016177CB5|nr:MULTISPECIES: 2-dehydropantoate 2-reductase [unclassified Rhizobium]MBB3382409.1 2-dehydropantoate 2-reductase [Rhizobium sp. BK098]MBB3614110.1 2-dehydropantoate 2-reductase [Rhizobium sp. BK609]MBB3680504.1 2-dehydropantoate 2-reductase [Rhizobium sp. BK612]